MREVSFFYSVCFVFVTPCVRVILRQEYFVARGVEANDLAKYYLVCMTPVGRETEGFSLRLSRC